MTGNPQGLAAIIIVLNYHTSFLFVKTRIGIYVHWLSKIGRLADDHILDDIQKKPLDRLKINRA